MIRLLITEFEENFEEYLLPGTVRVYGGYRGELARPDINGLLDKFKERAPGNQWLGYSG